MAVKIFAILALVDTALTQTSDASAETSSSSSIANSTIAVVLSDSVMIARNGMSSAYTFNFPPTGAEATSRRHTCSKVDNLGSSSNYLYSKPITAVASSPT